MKWVLIIVIAFNESLNAQTPKLVLPIGHTAVIYDLDISPDETKIVTASMDYKAILWNNNGFLLANLNHNGVVNTARFDQKGEKILTASDDSTASIWDAKTGKHLHHITGHHDRVTSAVFDPGVNIF